MHESNTVDFFFHTGKRKTTPSCPVKLRADYNPSSGAQSYWESDFNCTTPSKYFIPFFLENLGPKYSEYTVNAHEARPGHHTQVCDRCFYADPNRLQSSNTGLYKET